MTKLFNECCVVYCCILTVGYKYGKKCNIKIGRTNGAITYKNNTIVYRFLKFHFFFCSILVHCDLLKKVRCG